MSSGRDDAYIPAAQKQFLQFPGLGITVHDIVTNGQRLAMRFSEHGASRRHGGAVAVWAGLGLYAWNGVRLTGNCVEQDYYSRRRQFATGVPDVVAAPAAAPWDTAAVASDLESERVVRAWIADGSTSGRVRADDGTPGPVLGDVVTTVEDLFSAGDRVAFRLVRSGRFLGGLDDVDPNAYGQHAVLHLVGLVTVAGGEVVEGHLVRDRLGLARALAASRDRDPLA